MPARYTVTDLGTLGGAGSRAYAINNDGIVVGEAETAGRRIHAFVWKRGQGPAGGGASMTDLGTLGGPTSRAYDINSNGTVVGEADTTSGVRQAFVWNSSSGMTHLGDALRPFASFAYAINDGDLIAGGADSEDGGRAVVWSNGTPRMPRLDPSGISMAYDINASGYIAGQVDRGDPENRVSAAFIHRPTEPSTSLLPRPGGLSSSARAMNDVNQAAGYLETTNGETHAFVFDGVGGLRDIDTMSNAFSSANAINDAGQVVGVFFHHRDDDEHAFVTLAGTMHDLNDLVRTGKVEWVLIEAQDINDAGQIVGYGRVGDNERAFLLSPVPP